MPRPRSGNQSFASGICALFALDAPLELGSPELSAADSTGATLHALCADCLNESVEARPLFAAIEQTLAGLRDKV